MCTEDTTMIQLRSFVHQRLSAAAEEILGEVERTITTALALYDVQRLKGEANNHRTELGCLLQISATESPLTVEEVQQETPSQPSTQEESNVSTAEVPGPSETTAGTDSSDGNFQLVPTILKITEIKGEQEEIWVDGHTPEVVFPSPEGVKSEPEAQVFNEVQPECSHSSASQSESTSSDEEWKQNKAARAKKKRRRKVKVLRRNGPAVLPDEYFSTKSPKERRDCPTCGKSFQKIRPFIKHLEKHWKKNESTKELLQHLQSTLNKQLFCPICGKKFTNSGCLQLHLKIHTGIKDFKCQDCGKTFVQKQHLVVHMRTHSGERPFHCDICGKRFIQGQNLTVHRRTHTGEKPYRCQTCGKRFGTSGNLKTHMERFSGMPTNSCDVCGKNFCSTAEFLRHQKEHVAESFESKTS